MEFSYLRYDAVATAPGVYDWTPVEQCLAEAAGRRHQAILRFYDTYPGQPSAVPKWIKSQYRDVTELSEKQPTGFPDWSSRDWQTFISAFYKAFAAKFDADPRLAFLEVGFGLWSEYHVYDPGERLGVNFPSKEFQEEFFKQIGSEFLNTRWLISKDASATSRSPFVSSKALMDLPFGVFDDTFSRAWVPGYNRDAWQLFGKDRWKLSPRGGEQLIGSESEAVQIGKGWRTAVQEFHLSFILAEQWPQWINAKSLRELSGECGYRFRVSALAARGSPGAQVESVVTNDGAAPCYYDVFPAMNGVRARESLRGLLPGESRSFVIPVNAEPAFRFTLECDRLSPGEVIEFEANLAD